MTALAPSGHPAPTAAGQAGSHPAVVRLAAWTVAKQPSGEIDVTLRQLEHPAQLQATLRADGLPAHVSFSPDSTDAVCHLYAATVHRSPWSTSASSAPDDMQEAGSLREPASELGSGGRI